MRCSELLHDPPTRATGGLPTRNRAHATSFQSHDSSAAKRLADSAAAAVIADSGQWLPPGGARISPYLNPLSRRLYDGPVARKAALRLGL
jgi:hypothetical protein